MSAFEYYVEPFGLEQDSDELGAEIDEVAKEGWEPVLVLPGHLGEGFRLLFKRPIERG